jgi:7,8-dihydroneopterin aldolase/epimerase/oxygenase
MKIGITNAKFFAFHGYFEQERIFGNHFIINVHVEVPNQSFQSENLATTVDYGDLYTICKNQMQMTRQLLESVAFSILDDIKTTWPEAIHATVRIDKVGPQLGGPLDTSFIEVEY